jgi:hypothetical protein
MKITLKSCLAIAIVSLVVFWTAHFAVAQRPFTPERKCFDITRPKPSNITDATNLQVAKDVENFALCYIMRPTGVQSPIALKTYVCQKHLMIEIGNANAIDGKNWQVLEKGIREFLQKKYPKLAKQRAQPELGKESRLIPYYKIFYNRDFDRYNIT